MSSSWVSVAWEVYSRLDRSFHFSSDTHQLLDLTTGDYLLWDTPQTFTPI
jgi:hypothetical protein